MANAAEILWKVPIKSGILRSLASRVIGPAAQEYCLVLWSVGDSVVERWTLVLTSSCEFWLQLERTGWNTRGVPRVSFARLKKNKVRFFECGFLYP